MKRAGWPPAHGLAAERHGSGSGLVNSAPSPSPFPALNSLLISDVAKMLKAFSFPEGIGMWGLWKPDLGGDHSAPAPYLDLESVEKGVVGGG